MTRLAHFLTQSTSVFTLKYLYLHYVTNAEKLVPLLRCVTLLSPGRDSKLFVYFLFIMVYIVS